MRCIAVGVVALSMLGCFVVGLGQDVIEDEAPPEAWEYYVGTWEHEDDHGNLHVFVVCTHYNRLAILWDRSDPDLGWIHLGSEVTLYLFTDGTEEDRYGVAHWTFPGSAYGVLYRRDQKDDLGNDQILLTLFRYTSDDRTSEGNRRMTMMLTRKAEDGES